MYAMKVLEKNQLFEKELIESVVLEKNILKKSDHPFLVHLNFSFQSKSKVYMVMDYI
jgi:serine/threonine protein kinase